MSTRHEPATRAGRQWWRVIGRALAEHRLHNLRAQRLYAMCCGYEDLNDRDVLRDDTLMQTPVGRGAPLASPPTFSRLENRATRAQACSGDSQAAGQATAPLLAKDTHHRMREVFIVAARRLADRSP